MSSVESRRHERVALDCEIGFKRHGDARYQVGLFNLSAGGCCLSPPTRLDQGDRISVRLPQLDAIHGDVAWVGDWKAGVRFDNPFHQAVFDVAVRRLAAPELS